jgi:hypothetical protein
MAVVSLNSSQLTNAYSTPVILSNPFLAGGNDIVEVANIAYGATDSAGSIYRYVRVPSNARIQDIQAMNDVNTAGTSYKCGVFLTGPGVVPVAFADQIFFSAVSFATIRSVWTSLFFPAILNATGSAANAGLRIFELLGLATDPSVVYDLGVTAVTAGSAGGNVALAVSYVR